MLAYSGSVFSLTLTAVVDSVSVFTDVGSFIIFFLLAELSETDVVGYFDKHKMCECVIVCVNENILRP